MRFVVTIGVFAAMLALIGIRPGRLNDAWWTTLGAAAMLLFGLVSPREALGSAVAGKNALLFLLALLTLSMLLGKSGFFDWAAIRCARTAKGSTLSLYRNAFLLGAAVTAIFSLDTTAAILTPVMLAFVRRLKLSAAPYVVMCAFVANVGSLALPISNLTNILVADAFRLTFAAFLSRMIGPQLVALFVTYAALRWHFRGALRSRFDSGSLPDPASVVPDHLYFIVCVTVLVAVFVGYFVAPLFGIEPYAIAFAGSGVLMVAGALTGCVHGPSIREISWSLFPFVVGLFVAVRGLENLGIVGISAKALAHIESRPESHLEIAAATAIASNLMNNLPAALLAKSVLVRAHASDGAALAALVGTDIGPMITPFGSLATMLVLAIARREGEHASVPQLVMFGLWAVPTILLPTVLTLTLTAWP